MKRIRTKLVFIMSVTVILPILLVGTVAYMVAINVVNENAQNAAFGLNEQIAHTITEEFTGYLNGLITIGDSKPTEGQLTGDLIMGPENEEGITSGGPVDEAFELYVDTYEAAYQIFLGGTDGSMKIYPDFEFDDAYDPRTRGWFTRADEETTPGWTDMYQDAVTGDWVIAGSVPVYSEDNELQGVVGMSLDLSGVSEAMTEIEVGEKGYVFIIDEKGMIIAHHATEKIGEQATTQVILDMLKTDSQEGILYYSYDGMDKYAVYQYIPELRWYVLTSIYSNETQASTVVILYSVLGIGALSLVLSSIGNFFFANSITKPILTIAKSMKKVENGDMTVATQVKSKDETGMLGASFNQMTANVRVLLQTASDMVAQVSDASSTLAASADQVSSSSVNVSRTMEEIAKGSTEQARDTEIAVQLSSDLDEKFRQLSQNSSEIAGNAVNVETINSDSGKVIEDLIAKSDRNMNSTDRISVAIDTLDSQSKDIGSIVQTITAISSQTNLLALNASIEAARAGEHGKGFAVVAEEIRKLAEESAASANQIGDIVKVIQNQTSTTVGIMGELKTNTDDQYTSVNDMNSKFREISTAINEISQQINAIDSFIADMSETKNDIVTSITNISAVSEENAAASQEVSATMDQQTSSVDSVAGAADNLKDLAGKLRDEISKFEI